MGAGDSGPAGVLLGQEVMALEAENRMEGAPRGTVRDLVVPLQALPALTQMSRAHCFIYFHVIFPSKNAF